jgi:hypothetical protein
MVEGWKNFPAPNPWFEPRELRRSTRWFEAVSRAVVILGWVLFVGGCVAVLAVQPITGVVDTPYLNTVARFAMVGLLILIVGMPIYRSAALRGMMERREFIPALTEERGPRWWWWTFCFVPVLIGSIFAGVIAGPLMTIERFGKVQIRVHYVVDGKRRLCALLVNKKKSSPALLEGEVVWITRPRWLVRPVAVDRFGGVNRLDTSSYLASDWLWLAFDRVTQRSGRRRAIRRRARALRKLRHDTGRDGRYA